jgi:hypothetical protein
MNVKLLATHKSKYVSREVSGEMVIVPLKKSVADMNEMFTLNEVGAFIWKEIDNVANEQELTDKILSEFDVDRETALTDLTVFLAQLSNFMGLENAI